MTPRRTLIDELTPYTLTADEGAAVRTGFDLALRTRYEDAHIAVCDLSEEALREALQAVEVFWSFLQFELGGREVGRTIADRSPVRDQGSVMAVDGNDRLPVRCPRCGHDEDGIHTTEDGRRLCLDCKGFCAPVVVPVGGQS